MGIALEPDKELDPNDPTKPRPATTTASRSATGWAPTLALAPAPRTTAAAGGAPAPAMTAPGIPAPTVAAPTTPVNRVQLATDTFTNLAGLRQSQYEADSRDNIRTSAGMGQIASGGLRTREGNLRLARERDLDTLQKDLSLKAAEGSIADASTAYQQALAGSQQGLAEKIGLGQLGVSQGGLELERERAGLDAALAKAGLTGLIDGEQTLAAKQQAVNEAMARGQLTVQEGQLALQTLAQQQGNEREGERLGLAREGLAEQTAARLQQSGQFTAQLAEAVAGRLQNKSQEEARLELDKMVAEGQLTQAQAQLAEQVAGREQQGTQFGQQLAQQASQFGATQEQQIKLAELADATQNRQIDVATAQGKNALLVELARIMAGPNGTAAPGVVRALAAAMGLELPPGSTTTPATGTPWTDPGPGGPDDDNRDTRR